MAAAPDDDFDAYFRAVFPKAVASARRITGNAEAAQDAALEALARAYARWPRVSVLEWRDAWVLRVTIHEALRQAPRELPATGPTEVGDPSELVDLRLALVQALLLLPRRQREVVGLRYLADLSEAEVAAAFGISRGSVKTHLHRGLAALRQRSVLFFPDGRAHAHLA